ncbi:hypothetical protein JCM15519_20120 [Fundidesulfovibrio butyratiphilus]
MEFTVYLAAKGFVKELVYELGDAIEVADRLVFAPGPPRPAAWAQNIWLNPRRIPIESIGDAAGKLRALQRNWSLFSVRQHRRAKLIEEKLPAVRPKPVEIGTAPPTAPLGAWTLLDKDVVVASPACSSPFPHGEVLFVENKQDPPNRAYLKLWELFTLLGQAPSPGSFCLDLGGSPGGWAWVLASLGCRVLSVDKALLDPRVEAMPGVESRQLSAFALDPREVGVVDWLFCDVICYPDRLWRLVDRWRTFGRVKNFVCTVKFQGATDHETAAKFASWPGAKLVHLFNNKHELTWVLLDQKVDEDSPPLIGPKFFALRQEDGGAFPGDVVPDGETDRFGEAAQADDTEIRLSTTEEDDLAVEADVAAMADVADASDLASMPDMSGMPDVSGVSDMPGDVSALTDAADLPEETEPTAEPVEPVVPPSVAASSEAVSTVTPVAADAGEPVAQAATVSEPAASGEPEALGGPVGEDGGGQAVDADESVQPGEPALAEEPVESVKPAESVESVESAGSDASSDSAELKAPVEPEGRDGADHAAEADASVKPTPPAKPA